MWFGCWGTDIFVYFFNLLHFFAFFHSDTEVSQGFCKLALLHLFWSAGKKPIWGLPSPRPAVKVHLTLLCWRSAALVSPGRLSHRAGRTQGQKGRAREKGNYMLGFADKMNLPAVPERPPEQKVSSLLVLSQQDLCTCLRLTPELSDLCGL